MDAAIIAMLAPAEWEPTMGAFLPSGLDRARATGPAHGPELWAHCVVTETGAESMAGDMRFFSAETGQVVAEVQGFRLRLVPGSADKKSLASQGAFHRLEWRPCDAPQTAQVAGRALVIATGDIKGDAVAEAVVSGMAPAAVEVVGARELESIATFGGYGCVALVLPPSTDAAVTTDMAAASDALLRVAHVLSATPRAEAPRVAVVVTRGCQQARAGEQVHSVAHAALWGMARCMNLEVAPATGCRVSIVDAPHDATPADAAVLAQHVSSLASGATWLPETAVRGGELRAQVMRKEQAEDAPAKIKMASCGGHYIVSPPSKGAAVLKSLRLEAVPRRAGALGEGKVEIAVKAASLNFRDVLCAAGMLPAEAVAGSCWGTALGCECSGVVTAVGAGSQWHVGDEVIAWASHSFAGSVVTEDVFIRGKPTWASFEEAAALPIVYVTAHYALAHQCRIQPGEWLLLHSAAGGVGIAAINLARAAGVRVIATASKGKHEYLRSLGLEHVLDSGSLGFHEEVMRITEGRGVDVVINSLSGKAITQSLRCLAPFGR
eukprot:m51a1_g13686 putative polyketide synthase (550) ;mRNA; r:77-1962